MRGWIDWARKYPMTMLLIICCLIGGPYFGGQRAIEAYKNYTGKATAADVLGTWTQKAAEHPTLLKADAQGTKEQQAAKKGGPFTDVDQSYLDDAVFIGDSRTDTLKMYAGWENTTYYVKTGTNIWDIMDVVPDDEDRTIDEELQNKQFGKDYIMLGVNELGTGTAETYDQQFKKVVARGPEMPVMEGDILDYNEVLDDENGALKADSTFDGVHLQADKIEPWKQFILSHGVK